MQDFRTYSRLITLNKPVSMPDSSILEGSKSTPSLWAIIALPGGCSSSMTDCMSVDSDTSNSSGFFTPRLTVRLPCGSASINKTLFPVFARPTPRLTVVVVLPTPPFWFVIAITLQFSMRFPPFLEFTAIHFCTAMYLCVICPRHPTHIGNTSDACLRNKSMGISPLPGSPPAP